MISRPFPSRLGLGNGPERFVRRSTVLNPDGRKVRCVMGDTIQWLGPIRAIRSIPGVGGDYSTCKFSPT